VGDLVDVAARLKGLQEIGLEGVFGHDGLLLEERTPEAISFERAADDWAAGITAAR
jgi:hypothetical protein